MAKSKKTKSKRTTKRKTKRKTHEGMRRLGEKDMVSGFFLTVLGGLTVTFEYTNQNLIAVGSVLIILGLILVGFGLSDYLSV